MQGNHDAFDLDVEDDKSERLFQTYSSRGRQHSRYGERLIINKYLTKKVICHFANVTQIIPRGCGYGVEEAGARGDRCYPGARA